MATQTIEQVQRLAPYLEGIEQRLLNTAFGQYDDSGAQTAPGLLDTALNLPQQKVAGLDPLQQQALNMAPGMVGSYAPFTLGAAGQTLGGQASLASGLGLLSDPTSAAAQYGDPYAMLRQLQGAGAIAGGLGSVGGGMYGFSPSSIAQYMDPYQQDVIDQAMRDIGRQAKIQEQSLGAKAVGSGAFGGSRQGVAQAELGRATLDQKARTSAQLRASGYESAAKRAQQAFEDQQKRTLSGSELMGKLGSTYAGLPSDYAAAIERAQKSGQLMGGIGQAYGQLAGTTADIGRVQSELGRADLGMLTQLGDIGRSFQQQQLEAQRQNQLQATQEPYTRLEIGQQLLKGVPSAGLSSTFKSATTPDTNPFLAGVGAYTALQGIKPTGST